MRIRFFNTYEVVTTFYRDLLPYLAAHGAEIEVVLTSASYRTSREPLEKALDHPNIAIRRIWSGRTEVSGRWDKLWVMITYAVGASLVSLFGQRADLNVFLTQPPLFSAWGVVLRRIRGQQYVSLVMDIYPDLLVEAGVIKKNGILARLLSKIATSALKSSDKVIVIGRLMAERIKAKGVPTGRIHLIQNWANEHDIRAISASKNQFRKELFLERAFVVLYSGNMGITHHFEDLLEVAGRLRDVKDLRFVFIGSGIKRPQIERSVERLQLENVLLLPYQAHDRLAESQSLGDVHFVCLGLGFSGLVVPSKTYGALAAGRPVIYQGQSEDEIAQMVSEGDVGIVVSVGDKDGLEAAIRNYYATPSLRTRQGRKALALANGKYSRQSALAKYGQLLLGK